MSKTELLQTVYFDICDLINSGVVDDIEIAKDGDTGLECHDTVQELLQDIKNRLDEAGV